jgi:hypothetical protein
MRILFVVAIGSWKQSLIQINGDFLCLDDDLQCIHTVLFRRRDL